MRAPNTGRPAVGKAGRGYRTPDSPAPPRRFALEESPAHVKHGPDRPRGASSPVHAAIHADAAAPSVPLTPASPAAGPTGWRRRAAPPRTAALRSRAAESTRGASSPAHAAYTPMMPRTPTPFAPAGAEKAHAAADGSGAYQIVDRRRSAKHARRVLPRARRHTCRCCRALRPPSRQRALKTSAAAESPRRASSPAPPHTRR